MGQYHKIYNLDRKEFLHPHDLGDGLKLWEFSSGQTMTALAYLLACSTGRGGGDFTKGPHAGRWAGDRIAIVGDYAEKADLPKDDAPTVYEAEGWINVSAAVKKELADQ